MELVFRKENPVALCEVFHSTFGKLSLGDVLADFDPVVSVSQGDDIVNSVVSGQQDEIVGSSAIKEPPGGTEDGYLNHTEQELISICKSISDELHVIMNRPYNENRVMGINATYIKALKRKSWDLQQILRRRSLYGNKGSRKRVLDDMKYILEPGG